MKTKLMILTLLVASMQMQLSAAAEKAAAPKPLVQIAQAAEVSE